MPVHFVKIFTLNLIILSRYKLFNKSGLFYESLLNTQETRLKFTGLREGHKNIELEGTGCALYMKLL